MFFNNAVFFWTRPVRKPNVSIERQVDHRIVMIQELDGIGISMPYSEPLPDMEARLLAEMYCGRKVADFVKSRIESQARDHADHAFPVIY